MKSKTLAVFFSTTLAFVSMVVFMAFDPDDYVTIDTFVTSIVHMFQQSGWVEFFIVMTTFGDKLVVILLAALLVYLLRRKRLLILQFLLALCGATLSAQIIKVLIGRIRPEALPMIGPLHSFSFPSGHATSAMVLYGFIAVLALTSGRSMSVRIGATILLALLVFLIGTSRIVLAAHFASDVLAGWLLGAAWLSGALLIPYMRRTVH